MALNSSAIDLAPFTQIEDYPKGYPRFASLMGAHPSFHIYRRFSVIRARLLLLKQDRVSVLEERLRELDRTERRIILLGSLRRDRNAERTDVLEQLDKALEEHDHLLDRSQRIMELPNSAPANVQSLHNWIEGTKSICSEEAAFLNEQDLCTTHRASDDGLAAAENLVEQFMIWLCKLTGKHPKRTASRDTRVFVYTGSAIRIAANLLLTGLVIGLLMIPIIVIHAFKVTLLKVLGILAASGLFVTVLSSIMHARAVEVCIGGATYSALLVMFIASNSSVVCASPPS